MTVNIRSFLHNKKKAIKALYGEIFPLYIDYLRKELYDWNTVLDLGCGGDSPIQYCNVSFSVGVELFESYLQKTKKKVIHNQCIKADIRKIEFKPKSFDIVVALDVLEHLTKEEGSELIKKMEKWARKKIIVFTPNGFVWQDDYDYNPFQVHKSGWDVQEFDKLGFKVFGINGWKRLRGYSALIKYRPTILWNTISNLTQKITCRNPKFAFQLLVVKEIDGSKK